MFNYAVALNEVTGFDERIAECVECGTLYNYWADQPIDDKIAYCSFECECTVDDTKNK